MELRDFTRGSSRIVARITAIGSRIKKGITVTVSEHSPESTHLTHALPKTMGWRLRADIPLFYNGRKDYIRFLTETNEKEIWIKVSTKGGRSKVYVR
jgi:hypothetical protein